MAGDDDATATRQPRKVLDRALIVQAAIHSIDRNGTQGLTMRGLGQDLGVEAMTLYRYVTSRDDLLEAIAASLLDELAQHLDENLITSWQGYLQAYAQAIRQIAVDHPAAFPLVATRHPAAPWLRPPLRSIELAEDFLTTLSSHGLTDHDVVDIYRTFSSFLLGSLLLESAVRAADTAPFDEPLDQGQPTQANADTQVVDLSTSPTITRLRPLLSEDHSEEEFDTTLHTLLDRVETTLSP